MTGTNAAPLTPDDPRRRSLVRKLAEVMGEVERVPKSGRNDFHRYDYATEADIVSAVRKAMADRALMLIPSVVKTEWHEVERSKGGKDRLVTLTVQFTLHDGDSGEEKSFEVLGEGQDQGDKATYKALTGAVKYALLKLFLIPTGDDPEDDGHSPKDLPRRGGAPRARQPSEVAQAVVAGSASARPASQAGGADDDAAAIVAEAEQAATEAECKALGVRARKLPDGPLKKRAAAALQAAAKRLGIETKKPATREPGAEG
ncbi:ERF family protein [Corallococcus sp. bb12-1]|uniref:ERF family protein n=1 Tax=Corallococcus sp. bb12-1 TaxID=2996784 RepID=UPI002271BAFF|nr:ERF family protein [Corallococcus sp. bb12-1]MCY1042670.1 ERF family protein [Corallococcus sp. bb12-1]